MKTIYILIFFVSISAIINAQQINITGFITDSKSGEAINNVTVFEINSQIGTITNEMGYYKLSLEKGLQEIHFTEPDFESYTLNCKMNSDTTLNIPLKPLQQKIKGKTNSVHAHYSERKRNSGNKLRFNRFY